MNRIKIQLVALGCAALALLSVSACSGKPQRLSEDDPIFQGLDRSTVTEVLDSSRYQKMREYYDADDSEEGRERFRALSQGMVRAAMDCRSYFATLRAWEETGKAPKMPPIATPQSPEPLADSDLAHDQNAVRQALEDKSPETLRQFLAGPASCGEWVTVRPNHPGGETIQDALGGPPPSSG